MCIYEPQNIASSFEHFVLGHRHNLLTNHLFCLLETGNKPKFFYVSDGLFVGQKYPAVAYGEQKRKMFKTQSGSGSERDSLLRLP